MWKSKLNKASRSILSDYPHDFVNLSCKQFKPNQDLEYGLPVPNGKSIFFMIKPNSNTLGFYVFSDESYYSSLSQIGDIDNSDFHFSEITNKNLFLAVHKDGHFYQKINVENVIKELSTFAHLNNSTFLLQLDSVDLNLSRLHSVISNRLSAIREPIHVKRESGNYTKNHKEKNRDLDTLGDDILKSLSSGICSSAIIWCFSAKSPNIGFAESKASVSWVNIDSDVISQNVSISNKFKRLFKKSKNSKINDIFNTSGKRTQNNVSYPKRDGNNDVSKLSKLKEEYDKLLRMYDEMIESGKIPKRFPDEKPVLGDKIVYCDFKGVGTTKKERIRKYVHNYDGSASFAQTDSWFIHGYVDPTAKRRNDDDVTTSARNDGLTKLNTSNLIRFDTLRVINKEVSRYLHSRKNSPAFFFDGDVILHQKNVESSKTVDSDNLVKSESFEDMKY